MTKKQHEILADLLLAHAEFEMLKRTVSKYQAEHIKMLGEIAEWKAAAMAGNSRAKWLKRRVAALEKLATCYRCNARATEKLLTELEVTERQLKKYKDE